jgi:hypothetical protein
MKHLIPHRSRDPLAEMIGSWYAMAATWRAERRAEALEAPAEWRVPDPPGPEPACCMALVSLAPPRALPADEGEEVRL